MLLYSTYIVEMRVGGGENKISIVLEESTSLRNSWSLNISGAPTSPISLGDIDNDGKLEIIVGDKLSFLYAINAEDGSLLWKTNFSGKIIGAVIGDTNGDGYSEIILGCFDPLYYGYAYVYALNGERGEILWFLPLEGRMSDTLVLWDIDSDDYLEVVFSVGSRVYAVNAEDGSVLWVYNAEDSVLGSPAIGDLDSDGIPDVVFGDISFNVYALRGVDGSSLWRIKVDLEVERSVVLGDIDGDNKLEVIVPNTMFTGEEYNLYVYALNGEDGSILWKYITSYTVYCVPALGDLDGDMLLEVVFGDDTYVYAVNGDGSLLWRAKIAMTTSPTIADIDGDNRLDVVFGSGERLIGLSGFNGSIVLSVNLESEIVYSPLLCDLDADRQLEFVVACADATLRAFDVKALARRIYWEGLCGEFFDGFYRTKNARFVDSDADSLSDMSESLFATNLDDWDTDNDGMADGWEVFWGLDPLDPKDSRGDLDGDGLSNRDEYRYRSNPMSPDTDGDLFLDGIDSGFLGSPTNTFDNPFTRLLTGIIILVIIIFIRKSQLFKK